jgi:hypothetical protein
MGIDETQRAQRERLLRILSAATFLIFFQAYMIAPLLPALALEFGVSAQAVGMAVPAYLIPYGASTLAYGLLSDRLGRRRLVLGSLLAFVALLALTATARSSTELIAWRFVAGVGAGTRDLRRDYRGAICSIQQVRRGSRHLRSPRSGMARQVGRRCADARGGTDAGACPARRESNLASRGGRRNAVRPGFARTSHRARPFGGGHAARRLPQVKRV